MFAVSANWTEIEYEKEGALNGEEIELARQAIRQFVAKVVIKTKSGNVVYTFPLRQPQRGSKRRLDIMNTHFL